MTVYNDGMSRYVNELFVHQDEGLKQAWENTPRLGLPAISVKPEEGRFLQVLVRACGVAKAVEIGTLGGFSGIWIARGLLPGGRLTTLEKEPRHAEVARAHFVAAGVADIVTIRVGDAHQSLRLMESERPFDFVFIDAEKPGYPEYFNWALENIRLGGLIAAHNAFRGGSVAGLRQADSFTEGMIAFNQQVAQESRVISTIFPAGDGTLLAVKIS
jgi:predicted O-methyltransferase YrrM